MSLMGFKLIYDAIYISRASEARAKITFVDSQNKFRDGAANPHSYYEFVVQGITYKGFASIIIDPNEQIGVRYFKNDPRSNHYIYDEASERHEGIFTMTLLCGVLGWYCYATGWNARRLEKYHIFFNIKHKDKIDFKETTPAHFITVMLACILAISLHYLAIRNSPILPSKPLSENLILSFKWISFLASIVLVGFSVKWKAYKSGVVFLIVGILMNPFIFNKPFWLLYSGSHLFLIGFIIYATVILKSPQSQQAEDKLVEAVKKLGPRKFFSVKFFKAFS